MCDMLCSFVWLSKISVAPIHSPSLRSDICVLCWPVTAGTTGARMAESEALTAQGDEFLASENYSKAIECYSSAISLDPANLYLRRKRAEAYIGALRLPASESDGYAAIRINKSSPVGYRILARALAPQFQEGDDVVFLEKLADKLEGRTDEGPPIVKERTERMCWGEPAYFGSRVMLKLCLDERFGAELEKPDLVRSIGFIRENPQCIEEFASMNPVILEMLDASIALMLEDDESYYDELVPDFPSAYHIEQDFDVAYESEAVEANQELADSLREKGNGLLKGAKDADAVAAYSQAIAYSMADSRLFGNRAAAFMNMTYFELAIGDCELALEISANERILQRKSQCYTREYLLERRMDPLLLVNNCHVFILVKLMRIAPAFSEIINERVVTNPAQVPQELREIFALKGAQRMERIYKRLHSHTFRIVVLETVEAMLKEQKV